MGRLLGAGSRKPRTWRSLALPRHLPPCSAASRVGADPVLCSPQASAHLDLALVLRHPPASDSDLGRRGCRRSGGAREAARPLGRRALPRRTPPGAPAPRPRRRLHSAWGRGAVPRHPRGTVTPPPASALGGTGGGEERRRRQHWEKDVGHWQAGR